MVNHEKWLLKRGLHPTQIKVRKDVKLLKKIRLQEAVEFMRIDRNGYDSARRESIAGTCPDKSIMKNLHNETPEVQRQIIAKANRVAPLYSKGAVQYITNAEDTVYLGRKV
jgi:hypothetical protein